MSAKEGHIAFPPSPGPHSFADMTSRVRWQLVVGGGILTESGWWLEVGGGWRLVVGAWRLLFVVGDRLRFVAASPHSEEKEFASCCR